MKRLAKILVLAASTAAVATSANAQLVKHEAGVAYEHITACLDDIGFQQGVHYRKNPDKAGVIQLNGAAVYSDFLLSKAVTRADIDACWTKAGTEKYRTKAKAKAKKE